MDPSSDADGVQTAATKRFKADDAAQKTLAHTEVLSAVSANGFDAIFYPGGHGPLWDPAEDGDSKSLIEAFAASERPVGAVCHVPAVFKHTKGADGKRAGVPSWYPRLECRLAGKNCDLNLMVFPRAGSSFRNFLIETTMFQEL